MRDLIDRQNALDALEWTWAGKKAIDAIKNLPSAEPDADMIHLQKEQAYMQGWEDAKASAEPNDIVVEGINIYCPNCGYKTTIIGTVNKPKWIPLRFESEGDTNFPYELDGHWVIVTDGETISVERIKKDAYDHFFPNGRWFELEDVKAWMPLPEPYKEVTE